MQGRDAGCGWCKGGVQSVGWRGLDVRGAEEGYRVRLRQDVCKNMCTAAPGAAGAPGAPWHGEDQPASQPEVMP